MAAKKTLVPANNVKPATGAEEFEQMQSSRLLLERTLQGRAQTGCQPKHSMVGLHQEVESREREAEGHVSC